MTPSNSPLQRGKAIDPLLTKEGLGEVENLMLANQFLGKITWQVLIGIAFLPFMRTHGKKIRSPESFFIQVRKILFSLFGDGGDWHKL